MVSALSYNVFDAPEKPLVGDPMTSTLIYGENDAVLVGPLTEAEAEALAAWARLHYRNLTMICITHGHLDHFARLSVLLRQFPGARACPAAGRDHASRALLEKVFHPESRELRLASSALRLAAGMRPGCA